MKVAIIFIGTSKYINFLPMYYENIHKYFLPNSEKTILAFTDGTGDFPDDIKVYHQEHLDWPYITLKRFEIINKARTVIEDCDWVVFIDGDALVVDTITEEEFFNKDKPLFGVHHPCHYLGMDPHTKAPGAYEQNPKSEAYVDVSKSLPPVYWQGCLWGGKVPEVCAMIDELEARVNRDLDNNIVALWHDESQINRYFLERTMDVHTLGSQYAYPECFADHCNFDPKIVHLAKENSKYHV